MHVHLTARCRRFLFDDAPLAGWAWARLQALFRDALAACLMGNHLHLVLQSADPQSDARSLARFLGSLTRRVDESRGLWIPAPPSLIADRRKLAADIRYVVLNPCRAKLVADPLAWPWSTLRDVSGAVARPWITADRLAGALGQSAEGFGHRLHLQVTDDTSVRIGGTPPPVAASPTALACHPLERIARAACAATRTPRLAIGRAGPARDTFIHLAMRHGWTAVPVLAGACSAHRATIHRIASRPAPSSLPAGDLCLGDDRLLIWPL